MLILARSGYSFSKLAWEGKILYTRMPFEVKGDQERVV